MALTRAAGVNHLATAADAWHVRDRAFTAMCWQRINTRPGSGTWWTLFSGYEGNSANWVAAVVGQTASNTRFSFGWQTGPSSFSSFPENQGLIVPLDEWVHFAVVYYGGASRNWDSVVNGAANYSVASETLAFPTSTAAPFYLGYDPGNNSSPNGQSAFYRVFEGALSLAEIQAELRSPRPVNRRLPCSVDIPVDPTGAAAVTGRDRSFRQAHALTSTGTLAWTLSAPPVDLDLPLFLPTRRPWLWGSGGAGASDLVANDAAHGHAAEQPALTQTHVVAGADATHSHTAEQPALSQVHVLVAQDASHAHTADQPALTQAHTLTVADATHAHGAEQPALTQTHNLTAADATNTQTAESPALTQVHQLAVGDAVHAHAADNVELGVAGTLTAHDAGHGHTAESPALSQAHTLTAADAVHGQTADEGGLTTGTTIAAADCTHGHSVDQSTLTQLHLLAAQAAVHAHAAEQAAVAQLHALAAADARHSHTADQVTIAGAEGAGPPIATATHLRRLTTTTGPARITTQTGGSR